MKIVKLKNDEYLVHLNENDKQFLNSYIKMPYINYLNNAKFTVGGGVEFTLGQLSHFLEEIRFIKLENKLWNQSVKVSGFTVEYEKIISNFISKELKVWRP